jgi:hypothetical protein
MVMVHGLRLAWWGNSHLQHPHEPILEDHLEAGGRCLYRIKASWKVRCIPAKGDENSAKASDPHCDQVMNLMATDYCLT